MSSGHNFIVSVYVECKYKNNMCGIQIQKRYMWNTKATTILNFVEYKYKAIFVEYKSKKKFVEYNTKTIYVENKYKNIICGIQMQKQYSGIQSKKIVEYK